MSVRTSSGKCQVVAIDENLQAECYYNVIHLIISHLLVPELVIIAVPTFPLKIPATFSQVNCYYYRER